MKYKVLIKSSVDIMLIAAHLSVLLCTSVFFEALKGVFNSAIQMEEEWENKSTATVIFSINNTRIYCYKNAFMRTLHFIDFAYHM